MFRIVVSDARAWRKLLDAISTLVEEATFDIKPEGVFLRAMDPSHVAMVDFEYQKDAFQEFECSEATKICIGLGEMLKLLKRVGSGETLEMSLDPNENRLIMKLTGRYTRRFALPLLQPSVPELPTPKLAFDAHVKLDSDHLKDAILEVSNVSDQVRFIASQEKLSLIGESETGKVEIDFEKDNPSVYEFNVQGEVKALYGIGFLEDMVKAGSGSSKIVSVDFSTDKPVKLDFELPLKGRLTYYLAPRIE
ncbi:proliferating cell nuclear antigen (pcna) [Candidatus Bathyarchaeota archaeon]|nr:MAG: proliferating cell nuclear antigen (pcna) [Candidatus Bathyarchaeota archaeon]